MPDVLIWILVGWLMVSVVARSHGGCGRAARVGCGVGQDALERGGRQWADGMIDRRGTRLPGNRVQASAATRHRSPQRPATLDEREARLRSRYVSGEITVEQYEQGLDELYRRP